VIPNVVTVRGNRGSAADPSEIRPTLLSGGRATPSVPWNGRRGLAATHLNTSSTGATAARCNRGAAGCRHTLSCFRACVPACRAKGRKRLQALSEKGDAMIWAATVA